VSGQIGQIYFIFDTTVPRSQYVYVFACASHVTKHHASPNSWRTRDQSTLHLGLAEGGRAREPHRSEEHLRARGACAERWHDRPGYLQRAGASELDLAGTL